MRRRTRLSLLPVALVATLVALAGCGGSNSSSAASSGSALDAVTISGDVGTAPEVTWNSKMTATDVENTTLTKGDGDTVGSGDVVSAQIWLGNGYTEKTAYSTYDQGGAAEPHARRQPEPGARRRDDRRRPSAHGSR